MKTLLLAALLSIPSVASADPWSTADSTREATYLVLLATDYAQTKEALLRPNVHEQNPFLGAHPSEAKLTNVILLTAFGHAAISYYLPARPRRIFQYFTIGIEGVVVATNFSLGFKAGF